MKRLLRKLIKGLAYFGAAVVIILAIAVGIFRLMLPRLPEYQEEIKDWASTAIGMDVEFSGMTARWRLSGPELSFFDAGLIQIESGASILKAEEVSIGVGLLRLISDSELVVDRVSIRNSAIRLRHDENGVWRLQGIPFDELIGSRDVVAQQGGNFEIVGQNIEVEYVHAESGQLVPFLLDSIAVTRSQKELVVEAGIDLPEAFGDRLEISANQLTTGDDTWRLYIEGDSLNVDGWSRLQQVGMPEADSGSVDMDLWIDVGGGDIQSATANVVIADLHISGSDRVAPFGLQGRFEYSIELDGWLLAANELRFLTVDGDWPRSSLQVRVIDGQDNKIDGLRMSASYFDLDDLNYIAGWLPPENQRMLADYSPSGVLRDLSVELGALQTDNPQFNVSAELQSAGLAAVAGRPGVRGFSGRIRADRDGGRLEIESTDLQLNLESYLSDFVLLDDASGTIIWRRNRDGMIVLSDSVRIESADFESQVSLQVSMPTGDAAPYVDLESTWSVYDIGTIHRYLPTKAISPTLRRWLTDALVSGNATRGSTRFNGSLDKFPFAEGDGAFRVEARLEDATIKYSDKWPVSEFRYLDIVVENTRLYSFENSTVNLGNIAENVRIEIPDLRQPVLSIDAFATGTMESIKAYVAQSPIDDVLGGKVDRIEVGGDASFDLSIIYPIKDKENYDFSTKIRVSDGMVRVQGFPAPVTELNGVVNISRRDASSESLSGHFLGQPVDLELNRIGDDFAPHSVVLKVVGRTTAEALESDLGITLSGVIEGDADYTASVRFPNGRAVQPGALQIKVESDLFGIHSDLPAPLGKSDDEPLVLSMNMEFPSENQIATSGSLAGEINWVARFFKDGDAWDFDRGVISVGGEYPQEASVRGLHIYGQTPKIDLHAWLAEGRRGSQKFGVAERIRSIDLDVNRFYAVGQEFTDHRIQVNRSGQEWLIQISGTEASGLVTVPYDFSAVRPMTLNMDRLILPGADDTEIEDKEPLDPRSLPGIGIRVADFGIGARRFGELEVDFERTDRGLEATNLKTTDETYTMTGAAGWIIDAYEESGQRTYFDAEVRSTNVQQTGNRLNYESGIIGDSMDIDVDVAWAGGPRGDFLDALNGSISVRFGEGRLAEIKPGAGRVFGLMSFDALPRRLALDFHDVFDSGFSFDKIAGSFRIVNGEAYTCDLTVTGTAADVGMVGRASLTAREYDQSAVVSANVGNTLPVAGFVLGGPQIAAALLVFSQIFKKPLKDVGQIYYAVEGSWDDPVINRVDSQRFASTSRLASCIDVSQ